VTDSHTSVWGSAFDLETGNWGYRCCLLFEKKLGKKCKGDQARNEVLEKRAQAAAKIIADAEAEEVRIKKLEEESDESSNESGSSSDSSSSKSV